MTDLKIKGTDIDNLRSLFKEKGKEFEIKFIDTLPQNLQEIYENAISVSWIDINKQALLYKTAADYMFEHESDVSEEIILRTSILDNTGTIVSENKRLVNILNNKQERIIQNIRITNPHLWNAKRDPYLYTLNIKIEDKSGKIIDELDQPLGIRYFEIDKEKKRNVFCTFSN